MAKENNGGKIPPKAPKVEKTNNKKPEETTVQQIVQNEQETRGYGSLDANHWVDAFKLMHELFFKDPDAAKKYHLSEETVIATNEFTARGLLGVLMLEAHTLKSPVAGTIAQLTHDQIKKICDDMELKFNQKMLTAGPIEGTTTITVAPENISKEAKEAIAEELQTAGKKVEIDPTKVTKEGLHDALMEIMRINQNAYQKIAAILLFYRSWLKVQAKDNKEELKKIDDRTDIDVLTEVTELIGKCPFTLNGMGRFMLTTLKIHKNPILAFLQFRNATRNRATGAFAIEDQTIADFVRILTIWVANTEIAAKRARIDTAKEDIKILSKDKEANAEGIKQQKEKIASYQEEIKNYQYVVLPMVLNPSSELADNLIEQYKNKDANAIRVFKAITDAYMDFGDLKEYNSADIMHNVQQYAGIITNMFRDPMEQLMNYKTANLVNIRPVTTDDNKPADSETKTDEKPAEESKKA